MKKTDLQGYKKNFIKFLSVFMVIYPWITYLRLEYLNDAEKIIFGGYNGVIIDFFIYYKEILLIIVAIFGLLWFVGERLFPKKIDNNVPLFKGNNKVLFGLLGIFAVWVIISTIFAKYSESALWGSPTVGEGLWTLLAYVILIMLFYNYFANDYGVTMLKNVVTSLSVITTLLTIIEWFYKPLLEIGMIQTLVAPSQYAEVVSSIKASVFENAISLTFYNPSYYGGFVCILLPFVLSYCLYAKKIIEKIGYGILFVGLLFGVVASNSTTALYIAILEVVLFLVLYVSFSVSKEAESSMSKKNTLFEAGGLLTIGVVVLFLSGMVTGNSFFNIFYNENSATGKVVEERYEIEDIDLNRNHISLVGKECSLEIVYERNAIKFYDENKKELSPIAKENVMVFLEPEYEYLEVSVLKVGTQIEGASLCLSIDAGYQDTVDFLLLNNGTFSGVGQNGAILEDIKDVGIPDNLKAFYGLFTGRGYAWINSLPILKNTLIIGVGPGNFAYYFKQFDYVGMLQTHESVKQIIDKPHSAYLQYAINVGIPGMIVFFGVFFYALIKSTQILLNNKNGMGSNQPFHVAAIVSIAGFLIYSLVNDSIVTVTPIVCMLVGALLASCYRIENKI